MALIGEAGRKRNFGERFALPDHAARLLQPPHQQETMGARGESSAKVTRQRIAIEA
jgi:hypothetical protein